MVDSRPDARRYPEHQTVIAEFNTVDSPDPAQSSFLRPFNTINPFIARIGLKVDF
jgi:hypothetical protein